MGLMGPDRSNGLELYVDRDDGWSLAYPQWMKLDRSERQGRSTAVTLASFDIAQGSSGDERVPPLDRRGTFPGDGVAFRMFLQLMAPGPDLEAPESCFPISMESFEAAPDLALGGPIPAARFVTANGRSYRALVWVGAGVAESHRRELGEVIGSLAFPHLHPGEDVGFSFVVLDPEDHYPRGSLTPIHAGERPLILVHAPGGFYALGWNSPGPPDRYRATCDHLVDEARKEIYCSTCEARWDRIGRVITKPATAPHDEPLHLSIAKVGWDGHVLVHPQTYQIAFAPNARHLWPGWSDRQ
jgi:hypothetical protein